MKRILASLLFISTVFAAEHPHTNIIDYDASHKEAIMDIVFEDPLLFFCGSSLVKNGTWTLEQFNTANTPGMHAILDDTIKSKRVSMTSNRVAGFVEFYKTKELSLESLKKVSAANNVPFDENMMLMIMPHLKRTDDECETLAKIGCLAVSREFRRQGHGRNLMADATAIIKQKWPTIKQIVLDVNADNENAIKLYESEGFVRSQNQPSQNVMMQAIQYEKTIQ